MKVKVLILEHDSDWLKQLQSLLSAKGFSVELAKDRFEVIGSLGRQPSDIIIADILLARPSTIDFLDAVKEISADTEIILTSTTDIHVKDAVEAVRNGAFDLLLKQLEEISVIIDIIERIVEKQKEALESNNKFFSLVEKNDRLEALHSTTEKIYREAVKLLQESTRSCELNMDHIYSLCLTNLVDFTHCTGALLLGIDEANHQLTLYAQEGVEAREASFEIPIAAKKLKQFFQDIDRSLFLKEMISNSLGLEAFYASTLWLKDRHHGVVVLLREQRFPLSRFERGLLDQMMIQIGLILDDASNHLQIVELTARDGLTGLYNHRYFQERMKEEIERARRYEHKLTLLFCDVDDFKKYNDTHGHQRGDEVLIKLGKHLDVSSRCSDVLFYSRKMNFAARYGGEEFVLILPETSLAGGVAMGNRIRKELEEIDFFGKETQPGGSVTVSIGVAEVPTNATTIPALIKAADEALYEAKKRGKNRVCSASEINIFADNSGTPGQCGNVETNLSAKKI